MSESIDLVELRANLKEYQDQLRQVETLLLDDPENEEYVGIYEGLVEVVQLTQDLLAEAEKPVHVAVGASAGAPVAAITEAPAVRIPSALPPQVAEQIRLAQQRAAIFGQGPAAWAIGAKVQARYSGDGLWYNATVTGVTAEGGFIVKFDAYGNQEEVQLEDLRQLDTDVDSRIVYKGVEAPKRRKASENETTAAAMPKWLEIKPNDDEKTKSRKRKLIKSFKSKQRFQQMDAAQKQKADAWKTFMQGSKKKSGFLTGLKKESIFAVPEGNESKVGVIGSGQAMTRHNRKRKHEFNEHDGTDRNDND